MINIKLPKNCIIDVETKNSRTGKLKILSDMGADKSLVKEDEIQKDYINNDTRILYDVGGNIIKSKGNIDLEMKLKEEKYKHNFQVVESLGQLKADGILGRAFL